MKVSPDDKIAIWIGAYAVSMHALISSGADILPKTIDQKAKELADIATKTIVEKSKEMVS